MRPSARANVAGCTANPNHGQVGAAPEQGVSWRMRSDAFKMSGDFREAAASLERAIELGAHAPSSREAMAQEVMVLDHLAAAALAAAPAPAAPAVAAAAAAAAAPAVAPAAAASAAPAAATVPVDSSGAASALPTDHPDHLSEVATKVAYGALPAGSLAEAAAACSMRAYALAQGLKAPPREHVWLRIREALTLTLNLTFTLTLTHLGALGAWSRSSGRRG